MRIPRTLARDKGGNGMSKEELFDGVVGLLLMLFLGFEGFVIALMATGGK